MCLHRKQLFFYEVNQIATMCLQQPRTEKPNTDSEGPYVFSAQQVLLLFEREGEHRIIQLVYWLVTFPVILGVFSFTLQDFYLLMKASLMFQKQNLRTMNYSGTSKLMPWAFCRGHFWFCSNISISISVQAKKTLFCFLYARLPS